jgi:hypothetical protein
MGPINMIKVVFVGDKPSSKNFDPNVAFIGTQSYVNLCKWIAKLDINEFMLTNSYTNDDQIEICRYYNVGFRNFIALGNIASRRLDDLGIEHFRLPHPSGSDQQQEIYRETIKRGLRICQTRIKQS